MMNWKKHSLKNEEGDNKRIPETEAELPPRLNRKDVFVMMKGILLLLAIAFLFMLGVTLTFA